MIRAGQVQITGLDWIDSGTAVATPGTIESAGSFFTSTLGNLIADANFVSGSDLYRSAPGLIRLGQLSAAGDLSAVAGDALTLGDLIAGLRRTTHVRCAHHAA